MLNDFRVQTIVWDKAIDRIYETVRASEGDSNGRKLRVQILDRGKYVDLGGTSLSLAWKTSKEDAKGLDAFELVDSETGTFEIYYTTEMLGNVGRLPATLVLVDSVGRIESSPFAISVIGSNVDDDSVQSENSFTALTQALVTVSKYDSRITNVENIKADKTYVDSEIDETNDLINQTGINLQKDIEQHGFNLRWNEHLVVDGDWTQALQQALDDSPDDGRTIFIGQDIRIDSTIIWPNISGNTSVNKPCTIQGMAKNRSSGVIGGYQKGEVAIEFTGEGALFDLRNGNDSQTNSSVSFRDINLFGNSKEGSIGINADSLLGANFENMQFRLFDVGMRAGQVFYGTFDNLRFFYNLTYGLNVESEVNHTKFHRCNFSHTREGTGARVHYGQTGVVFDGCWFEGNHMALRLDYCMQALIQGCYFEANHNTMSILGHAETGHTVVTIIGSNFTTSTDSSIIPIRVNGQSSIKYNITMIGNTINHWTDTGVFLGGTGDKLVVDMNNRTGGVSIDYPTETVLKVNENGIYSTRLAGSMQVGVDLDITENARAGVMEVFNRNGQSAGWVQLYKR